MYIQILMICYYFPFSFLQRILSEIFLETKMEIINMLDNRLSHFQKHPFSYTFLKIVLVVHGSEILHNLSPEKNRQYAVETL